MQVVDSLDLAKQRVLIRVDFNVPLRDGSVVDDFRIRASLPTIKYCLERGSSVVLMSHLGRPGGRRVEELSLLPVGETLSDLLERPLKFSDDCVSDDSISVSNEMSPGEVHLLENLRFNEGETGNDLQFANRLSRHSTVFVNDAFGTAHRSHASNVGVARRFERKAMGLLMEKEYRFLEQFMEDPKPPMVMAFGGAKIGTKLEIVSRFLRVADAVIIGGGMAFTFLKAKGIQVGRSLVKEELLETAVQILSKCDEMGVKAYLPHDVITTLDVDSGLARGEKKVGEIGDDEVAVDIGKGTIEEFREAVGGCSTVVWNGPMGVFEYPQFRKGTMAFASSLAEVKDRGGVSIIGGGDTAAALRELNLVDRMSHVSTGGGAFLELLSGKKLPGFEALEMDNG